MQRELYPEIILADLGGDTDSLRFTRALANEELYLNLIQVSDYRTMEIGDVSRTTQGRTTNIQFLYLASISAGKHMTVNILLKRRNADLYDLRVLKGARSTPILFSEVIWIGGLWICEAGVNAYRSLTRNNTVGREFWRLLIGTRTDGKSTLSTL